MKYKYKMTDLKAIIFDPDYIELGPLGLVAVLIKWHFKIFRLIECGQLSLYLLNKIWLHQLEVLVVGEDVSFIFVNILDLLQTGASNK